MILIAYVCEFNFLNFQYIENIILKYDFARSEDSLCYLLSSPTLKGGCTEVVYIIFDIIPPGGAVIWQLYIFKICT